MCGIAGFLDLSRATPCADLERTAARMADALRHRGPDDAGVWADSAAGLALGPRRLCIIDPTPAGHQPMASACGRYVANYNGELYNFRALRRELEALPAGAAPTFRGHCDTEVLLAAVARWGLDAALARFNGM